MGIVLNQTEKAQLAGAGYAISVLPGTVADEAAGEGCPRAIYHNPKTGQEFRLLADPGNMIGYKLRGLRLGPAPPGLHYEPPTVDPADKYLPQKHDLTAEPTDYIALLGG